MLKLSTVKFGPYINSLNWLNSFPEGAQDLLDEVLRAAEPESEVEPETYAEPKGFDDETVDEGIALRRVHGRLD